MVDRLLSAQNDLNEFERQLKRLAASGEFRSVLVITHAMFELPWRVELRRNWMHGERLIMPKEMTEFYLDCLVGCTYHDGLSARYFRALLDGDGDVEEAKRVLIDWTLENEDNLVWDGRSFLAKEGPHG